MKRKFADGRKLISHVSDKILVSRMDVFIMLVFIDLLQFNNKKRTYFKMAKH